MGFAAGKRVLITGATNGIGLAAARELARRGAHLAIVARDEAKGAATAAQLPGETDVLYADLSEQTSVRKLASEALERYPRIHVLVNNAGAIFEQRERTADGIERTWALNHLAPFLLTNLLLERLKQSAPARVITTASDAHKGAKVPFDDLDAERRYNARGYGRYGETKLANILFTKELARRLEGGGVTANCFHPGLVATGFNRNNGLLMRASMALVKPFSRDAEKGAETLVWLADADDVPGSGGYFVDMKIATPTREAQDMDAAGRLWEISEEQTDATTTA
jgi:NAD(P)-dependent dehydrogenase (short-subunit alcohol dehydrogenase family)